MKKLLWLLFPATMGALGYVFYDDIKSMLTTDPCKDVVCQNEGKLAVKESGDCICICPDGFSGADCSVEDKCITQKPSCKPYETCDDGVCSCKITDNYFHGKWEAGNPQPYEFTTDGSFIDEMGVTHYYKVQPGTNKVDLMESKDGTPFYTWLIENGFTCDKFSIKGHGSSERIK